MFLQVFISALPSFEAFKVEENAATSVLEDLDCSLPELVAITSDCTDFVEFYGEAGFQCVDDASKEHLFRGKR